MKEKIMNFPINVAFDEMIGFYLKKNKDQDIGKIYSVLYRWVRRKPHNSALAELLAACRWG